MKNKLIFVLIGIIIFLSIIFINFSTDENIIDAQATSENIVLEDEGETKEEKKVSNNNDSAVKVTVDIKGAVNTPGVYEVDSQKRVIDVIKLAGGLNSNANTNYINLSSKVEDEMVIWIYTNKEISDLKLEQESTKYMISNCNCPKVDNTTCLNSDKVNSNNSSEKSSNDNKDKLQGLVNINNSSLEDLMKLEGIGESKARSIIDYRNKNGLFKSIEDIKNVSGIGESLYTKIKEYITV